VAQFVEHDAAEESNNKQNALHGARQAKAFPKVIKEDPDRQNQERPMQIKTNSCDLSEL
jgi:hypothetical protein